ncbi:late embryogenesis abundant protein At1g64065-like [Cynara cardunculus var. scolymus]|uniref:late embryogenesis abundant protein At1g64065-like n=1 Tax=Cynara cardunculus var. scolymus TaxID=59895 RepID=UPI000D6306F3|nr:late embryogenesis abundant protein At1g64065-like [Cynara cardunculus var. scolymus]
MNSATQTHDDFKRRRRAKWASYIIGGVIFQIFLVLVFLYVLLRVRSIKLYLHSTEFENFRTGNGSSTSSPSFTTLLHTQVTIKNSNFGHYKYQNSTVVLAYRGTHIGEAGLENGWAKARSVKKINITVVVSSKHLMGIVSDNGGSRTIPLTASALVTGKIHILKIVRRRKVAPMNCTMDVDTQTPSIHNLHCN